MNVITVLTPSEGDVDFDFDSDSEHRAGYDAFADFADQLSAYLRKTDVKRPERIDDYRTIFRAAAEAVLPDSALAMSDDGNYIVYCPDGSDVCYRLYFDGENCIIDSVGKPSTGWLSLPTGVTYTVVYTTDDGTVVDCTGAAPLFYMSIQADMCDECTYELPLTVPIADVTGVALRFGKTRSQIRGIRRDEQQGAPMTPHASDPGDNDSVRIFELTDVTDPIAIKIQFSGDPIVIGDVTWLTGAASGPRLRKHAMPHTYPLDDAGALVRKYARTIEEELAMRDEWSSSSSPTPSQTAHRLFLAIDRATLGVDDSSREGQTFNRVGMELSNIVLNRAEAFVSSPGRALEEHRPVRWKELHNDTRTALGFIEPMMHEWLVIAEGGERSHADIEQALIYFATGRATAFHGHGAPNGVNMFSFTELCLLLADHGRMLRLDPKRRRFWQDMAVRFAIASELFVHCYYRDHLEICGYKASHNPVVHRTRKGLSTPSVVTRRSFGAGEVDAIKSRWESLASRPSRGLTLRAVRRAFGRLVCSALRDDIPGAADTDVDRRLMKPTPPIRF